MVNITAVIGKTSSASSLLSSVSRAASMTLTKTMRKSLDLDNIRVNMVCIGWFRSE